MGVPSFFRWLLEKYPKVILYVKEQIDYAEDGTRILPDASLPNPNNIEFDNLYLDMNGIIHPCCHPEGGPQPQTEEEMIANIFTYIEHIFSMVRPRKLLYMAIDGVAPRAKMNQQRARRFRAAQERVEHEGVRQKLEKYYARKGWAVPPRKPMSWDHNVITPGTPFMDKLAKALKLWIAIKLHTDPGWQSIQVILSDANVPGEGEHKIAKFIRYQRHHGFLAQSPQTQTQSASASESAQPMAMHSGTHSSYDPNTSHVLYGLDADLFMLGLATHDPHFTILREEVLFGKNRPCAKCGYAGHFADRCTSKEVKKESDKKSMKPFVFAHLWVLREYLEHEFRVLKQLPWYNFESIIDDFIFLCFFVGNDFLPHLPSLEIREGAIDDLFGKYKDLLPKMGSYITEGNGKVNLKNVDVILHTLGEIEDGIFKQRMQKKQFEKRRNDSRADRERRQRIVAKSKKSNNNNMNNNTEFAPINNKNNNSILGKRQIVSNNNHHNQSNKRFKNNNHNNNNHNNNDHKHINLDECKLEDEYEDENQIEFLKFFDEYDLKVDEHFLEMDFEHQLRRINRTAGDLRKCKSKAKQTEIKDTVLFGNHGWKDRYYRQKLHIMPNNNNNNNNDNNNSNGSASSSSPLRERLCYEYIRGLCWIMAYYYSDCVSWAWFFPFHYAPFASDLANCVRFRGKIKFSQASQPFSPFGQLMGVLPATSGKLALPPKYSRLMYTESSPIIDFYPTDFKLDLNGKIFKWQAVILLPFIDEKRLLRAIAALKEGLTANEKRMDGIGNVLAYFNRSHPLSRTILSMNAIQTQRDEESAMKCAALMASNKESLELKEEDDAPAPAVVGERECIELESHFNLNGSISCNLSGAQIGEPLIIADEQKEITGLKSMRNGVDVVSCAFYLSALTLAAASKNESGGENESNQNKSSRDGNQSAIHDAVFEHQSALLGGLRLPEKLLTDFDFDQMENAPRFGKPRKYRRKDSHTNYNRGWDTGIGFSEGAYRARHKSNINQRFDQQTRQEYNASHKPLYSQAQQRPMQSHGRFNNQNPRNAQTHSGNRAQPNHGNHSTNNNNRNNGSTFKSVTVFPAFEPFPANDSLFVPPNDIWRHRPQSASDFHDPLITHAEIMAVSHNKNAFKNKQYKHRHNYNNNKRNHYNSKPQQHNYQRHPQQRHNNTGYQNNPLPHQHQPQAQYYQPRQHNNSRQYPPRQMQAQMQPQPQQYQRQPYQRQPQQYRPQHQHQQQQLPYRPPVQQQQQQYQQQRPPMYGAPQHQAYPPMHNQYANPHPNPNAGQHTSMGAYYPRPQQALQRYPHT